MYERHFGLRENPFAAGHQSKYVYPSREHQEALAHLRFGIENREPFVLITGEVGTGKTTALYDALSEWKSRAVVALITNSALTRSELYEEICMRFGVPLSGTTTKPQLIHQLERHLLVVRARGDFAILLIDEAQNLDEGLLEETRLLSNLEAQGEKLLQIFLVGQPELEEKLAQPALRQLRQRIAVHYRLRPLTLEDTEHYIHHRLAVAGGHPITVFPADACAEVHAATHGIPREINTVAAQALLNAFVEDSPSVRPEHVRAIVRDTGFQSVLDAHAAPPAAGIASKVAPPDAPSRAPSGPPAAAPAPPVHRSPPSAVSPVPVPPPDAPAPTREARPPAPTPQSLRVTGETPPSNPAEGVPMAGVRPAGSTESWQSWMESLAKQTEENVTSPEAAPEPAATGETPETGDPTPAEMSPEAFYAVEEEAMRARIGDDDGEDEDEEEYEDDEQEATISSSFDPNESSLGAPDLEDVRAESPDAAPELEVATPPTAAAAAATPPALAGSPDFEAAPGFDWDRPAAREREEEPWSEPVLRMKPAPIEMEAPSAPSAPAAPMEPAPVAEPVARVEPPAPAAVPMPPAPKPALEPVAPVARVTPPPAPPAPVRKDVPAMRKPAPTATPAPGAGALPMRLRERIEAAERAEAKEGNRAVGWLIAAAVIAVVGIGIFLAVSSRKPASPRVVSPAGTATSAPAVDPVPATSTPGTSSSTPSGAAPSSPPAATTPKPQPPASAPTTATVPRTTSPSAPSATKPAATTKPTATGPKPAAATSTRRYGVSVASFLVEDRARSEGQRLAAATGLPMRIVTSADGDYRVVLGSFSDRAGAEEAAGNLIGGGKVDEARVVPLAAEKK